MKISILTVCPECLNGFENWPNTAHAISNGALELNIVDIRKYAGGSFRHVDDSPFGGGAGCVLRAKPILDAVNDLRGLPEPEKDVEPDRKIRWNQSLPIHLLFFFLHRAEPTTRRLHTN